MRQVPIVGGDVHEVPGQPGGDAGGPVPDRPVIPLTPADPRRIGSYELLGRLGVGGMGTVYLGRGLGNRLVAVKVIRPEYAGQPRFRARFRREAELARRVARFCTAEVIEVGDAEPPYLVTEYVAGPTLTQAVAGGGPLRSGDLERLAVSVAAALAAIHRAGLIHRDLKPSNVLLSDLGPRVIDFGIARAVGMATTVNVAPYSPGTPAFMSPEQADGLRVTAASDIFAWGGLVAFAGTGRLPFGEATAPTVLYRVVHHEPSLDGLEAPLLPLVKRAMTKDPALRPTAEELLIELVSLGSGDGTADPELTAIRETLAIPGGATRPGVVAGPGGATAPDEVAGPGGATGPGRTTGPGGATGPGAMMARPPTPPPPPESEPELAPTARPAPPPKPDPPATDATRPGATARSERWRLALIAAAAAVVLLLAAAIPVLILRGGGGGSKAARVAARVVATADGLRGGNPDLAGRLSLAAYRISPTGGPADSVINSFSLAFSLPAIGHRSSVLAVATSPDGRLAATASADQTVELWDVSTAGPPNPLATLTGHRNWVDGVEFSPNGRLLASASVDGTVRLWDVTHPARPAPVATFTPDERGVRHVAFSPDSRTLACGGANGTAQLWDISQPAHPTRLAVLRGHTDAVEDVAFSPDGHTLATASKDDTIALWNVGQPRAATRLAVIHADHSFVWSVAFRPDGKVLASGGYDGATRLWDVSKPSRPRPISVITADHHNVYNVRFSPDGHTVVTSGDDTRISLWGVADPAHPRRDATLAQPDREIPAVGHLNWVQGLSLADGGRKILASYDDTSIRVWDIDPARLAAEACGTPTNQISRAEWARYIPELPYRPVC